MVLSVRDRLVPSGSLIFKVNSADSDFGMNSLPRCGTINAVIPSSKMDRIITRFLFSTTLSRKFLYHMKRRGIDISDFLFLSENRVETSMGITSIATKSDDSRENATVHA